MKYGYANTRVRAMESRLISGAKMQEIYKVKDVSGMLSQLMSTDYEKSMAEFGGLGIKSELVDFALSKNLAERVGKLVEITPKDQKDIVRSIIAKWDFYNVKVALEAKDRNMKFEDIASQLIDYGPFSASVIKKAMGEGSADATAEKLVRLAPRAYAEMLRAALKSKGQNVLETVSSIDNAYYTFIGRGVGQIRRSTAARRR